MRLTDAPSRLLAAAAVCLIAGCDLDVPDLNNPGLGDLEDNPTRVTVNAASTGLLIGNRRNVAQNNGYVVQLGILGREAYNFDTADPRYIRELLTSPLNQGSPFGGNFWALPYANIRLANTIQRVVDKVPDYTAEERAGILGFSKTIEALDLLEVVSTRDTNGGVIDTDRPLGSELAPIVDKPAMLAEIARLLDAALPDLAAAGDAFAFPLSNGYAGFDTPATFAQLNRAIRARVAAYQKDYPAVLAALEDSFLDETAPSLAKLERGVYHSFSTASGDQVNGLINPNIYAHPSLEADAMRNGATIDARFTRKVVEAADPGSGGMLSSDLVFTIYGGPAASVPIIRNEELILLHAEALYFTNEPADALIALNLVRQTSGGLPAIGGAPNAQQFTDALLYERRYSLMFEGHRWIDVRRFDRTMDLPLDLGTHTRNIRYPLPIAECNARPNEPACDLGSN